MGEVGQELVGGAVLLRPVAPKKGFRSTMKTKFACAFTLIEIVISMAIILILTGLVISIATYVQNQSGRARAKSEIALLGTAAESYKADHGG